LSFCGEESDVNCNNDYQWYYNSDSFHNLPLIIRIFLEPRLISLYHWGGFVINIINILRVVVNG
jgi:hypothetical protein